MRQKVNTAYMLHDPRKFDSIEEAERELNRLRAVCMRWKKKQGGEINCLLGLSVTDSQWIGEMGYDKPKNKGGKKQYIVPRSDWRIHNGERVPPCTDKEPHLHIMEQFASSIDAFLSFRQYKILPDKGHISKKAAEQKAFAEYEAFNKTQKITSDFDKTVQTLLTNGQ